MLQGSLAEANGGYGVDSGGVILNQNNASSGKPPKDGYMQCLGLMVIRGGLSAIRGRLLDKGKDVSSWASATVPVSSNPARVPNLVIPPPQGEGVIPRPSGAGYWQRGESQLQMFARMRTCTAQWLSLPPQIRKAYQHGILTDAALPLVPVESPGGFWLLRGLEAQEPPIDADQWAGQDALVSSGGITRLEKGLAYRGVEAAMAQPIRASRSAFKRLHSELSALDPLPLPDRSLLSLGLLPPPSRLQELKVRLSPAVQNELDTGAHLLPLICSNPWGKLSEKEVGDATADQVSKGGFNNSWSGNGYTASRWANSQSFSPGAPPPSRLVVRIRLSHTLRTCWLKASEAPVLKERVSTKELNWAIRSAEAHSYSRGGFACYEVLADGDERYGDFGPTCYAPITPWYTLPSPPIFQGKGFIFTNLSHALPKPTLLVLQKGIIDRGGRIVPKWSGSVAVVVAAQRYSR